MNHKPNCYHYRAEFYSMDKELNIETLQKTMFTGETAEGLNEIKEAGAGDYTRVEVYSVHGAIETFKEIF